MIAIGVPQAIWLGLTAAGLFVVWRQRDWREALGLAAIGAVQIGLLCWGGFFG